MSTTETLPEREATADEAFELGKVAGYDEAMRERAAERWWILEGGFRWSPVRGGRLYSGPYSTSEDAFVARRKLEQVLGHNQLFIEQEPAPERSECSGRE